MLICNALKVQAGEPVQSQSREPSYRLQSTQTRAGLALQGHFVQGGLLYGVLAPGQGLTYKGRSIKSDSNGRFVIGMGRDYAEELVLQFNHEGEPATELRFPIAPREYKIQRIEGIARKIMSPGEAALKRIKAEQAQVVAARAHVSDRSGFAEAFSWPILGRISGVYGSQRVYNGVPGRPHFGVDVARPTGAQLMAPASGTVVLALADMFYSGGTVILDHGYGLNSSFLHMSKVLVTVGQELQGGDLIGEVGATGRATGPHLDWRMNWFDQRVDPQLLVPPM